MDLKSLEVEETSILELLDSAEEAVIGSDGKPITVTVWGPGSKQYSKAKTKQSNRFLNRMKKKGAAEATAEERTAEDAEFLCACTIEFSENFDYDGLSGSEKTKAIYMNPKLGFISEQVAKHLGEWSNFTKGSTGA